MASSSQNQAIGTTNNKNLPDVLRLLACRSGKKRPARAAPCNNKQDELDRFVSLASTVLFTDSSKPYNQVATTTATTKTTTTTNTKETKGKTNESEVTKTQTPSVDPLLAPHIQADLKRYRSLLQEQDEEIENIERARKRVRQQQVDLWDVYKYGLQQIGNLQDLSQAPDAILPGNFCQ